MLTGRRSETVDIATGQCVNKVHLALAKNLWEQLICIFGIY